MLHQRRQRVPKSKRAHANTAACIDKERAHIAVPIVTTKLYMPRVRPDLVSRTRLVQLLNAGMHRQVTLISAPPGFGKTTVVADWLASADRPFAWLSVDENDNDPIRFFSHLIAALQGLDENLGVTAQGLLRSAQSAQLEPVLTVLINDLAALQEPIALVLDDYHHIAREAIHQAIDFVIAHQPQQLHLILVTRRDPPLALPRLRVAGQLTELRASDLRFTVEEAATFLDRELGLHLDPELVAALEARTEGWIAALQLAALSMRGRSEPRAAEFIQEFSGSHRHVIDYLAQEVVAGQTGPIQDFLRHTCILDRLSVPLCNALTGRDDSDSFLEQLEQANLFLIPLDDRREWYRYHSIFAGFLRAELDRETQAALHQKAATWLAASELWFDAVQHALAADNPTLAAQVVTSAAEPALRSASVVTLEAWLDALPDPLVRSSIELAIYKGFTRVLTGCGGDAASYASDAERHLAPDTSLATRGRLLCLKALLALCSQSADVTIDLSKASLECLEGHDGLFRSLAWSAMGEALALKGDLIAAADAYRQASTGERDHGNHPAAVASLASLVRMLNELGRKREAEALCREVAEESAGKPGPTRSWTDAIYLAWSWLSYEANALELAREQAQRALELCDALHNPGGSLLARYHVAHALLASGEMEAALDLVHTASERARMSETGAFYLPLFAALEAEVRLQRGNVAAAERWASEAGLTPADTPHRSLEPVYPTYVRLLMAQELLPDARTLLDAMERSALQGGRHRRLITVYLQQARAWQAMGQVGQALACVEKALRLAAPEGYIRAFLDEGPAILDLLPQVRSMAPAFVDQVMAAAGAQPPSAPASALAEPLSERELEILRLIAAGRSNPDIAELLYLSLNTVKWHVKNVYAKLYVSNRVEAAARGQELGLI